MCDKDSMETVACAADASCECEQGFNNFMMCDLIPPGTFLAVVNNFGNISFQIDSPDFLEILLE